MIIKINEWFIENLFTNIFTLFTVLLSGGISLLISAVYFHKGNRNNLKMSVIFPISSLLKEQYSRENYRELCKLTSDFNARYLHKSERKVIINLVKKYQDISSYNDVQINAECLYSYFLYTLRKQGIETKCVPIEIDGELIDYDYPQDLNYLMLDIQKNIKEYDIEFEVEKCQQAVVWLFKYYCKEYYASEGIVYFDDYSFTEVLEHSEIRKKWDKRFDDVKAAEEEFMKLKVTKSLL